MKTLDYQLRVLETFDIYIDRLKEAKNNVNTAFKSVNGAADLPVEFLDYTDAAWNMMAKKVGLPPSRQEVPFSPRKDGMGRPVPNVTLKVPTGGGKTYLAVNAVGRILNRYLEESTGFVLWVVPSEAIYTQTLRNFKDRDHIYRHIFDVLSGNRTKIMEKNDHLHAKDIKDHLCVMILMIQAGRHKDKQNRHMFRDRGDVRGFFPPEGDQCAHSDLLEKITNLDRYDGLYPMVKDSLGNALKVIRPVIVLDEGHKAATLQSIDMLYDLNPRFVLELTATPIDLKGNGRTSDHFANLLVEVTGKEVHREEMIKMPLNLDARQGDDWKVTLGSAVDRLKSLSRTAKIHHGNTGRYIRPILLVQVERTGTDNRDGTRIHAEDVREWLKVSGFSDEEIATKTSSRNDLKLQENANLLSEVSKVRIIITSSALQEGWDCSFAYILCSLATMSKLRTMTQLVGRILRQPYATRTGVTQLDECYVITHHSESGKVAMAVKNGLEDEGLGDLLIRTSSHKDDQKSKKILRRKGHRKLDIYLPLVHWIENDGVREIDYETDILSRIDWQGFNPNLIADAIPLSMHEEERYSRKFNFSKTTSEIISERSISTSENILEFDSIRAVREISDRIINPFVAWNIVERVRKRLISKGHKSNKIGAMSRLIIDTMRKELEIERDKQAERIFRKDVTEGRIQFQLRLDGSDWQMPSEGSVLYGNDSKVLTRGDGSSLKKSLFEPFYIEDLNQDERGVAIMLDESNTIKWWHRNVARKQYGLQGWKRGRIYPDFIFAVTNINGEQRIVALEMKGDHLQNPDTSYKRDILNLLSNNFYMNSGNVAGKLHIEYKKTIMECALILVNQIPKELPKLL